MDSTIKVRTNIEGAITTVRAMIRHPMETGRSIDPDTGERIPRHYIKEVVCEHNGAPVMTAQWGTGISKNPSLSFRFAGAKPGDELTLSWMDNQGGSDSLTTTLK